MTGAPTPDPFGARQLQSLRRLVDHRLASEFARIRVPLGEDIRNLRLAKTVARNGTYPATGNTFAIRLLDCGFTAKAPGSSTMSCKERTAEGDTDDADDVIAREINGQYVPEGTYVAALWQRGLEGDPDDYGEWWIRLKGIAGCVTFLDTFEREDSTDIGADWEECSGDWEILDGTLTTPNHNAVVACLHMVGWPVGIMKATVSIDDPAHSFDSVGGTAQIFAYVGSVGTPCSGTSGTWRLELKILSSSEGELSLYDPSNISVSDVPRHVFFIGTTCEMKLCVAWDPELEKGEITGSCTGMASVPIWTCHGEMPDYWFALGNGDTDQVYYESAQYIDHYDHNPLCPDCQYFCCCPCLEAEDKRPTLTATVVGNGDPACYVGGESTTLECAGLPEDCCVWGSPADAPLSLVCKLTEETHELDVMMRCVGAYGCEGYELRLSWHPGGGNELFCYGEDWPQTRGQTEPCSCDPLSLTFGPFRLWKDTPPPPQDYGDACNCCEEFYIVVSL